MFPHWRGRVSTPLNSRGHPSGCCRQQEGLPEARMTSASAYRLRDYAGRSSTCVSRRLKVATPVATAGGRVRPTQPFAGPPRVPGGDCSQNCSCSILTIQQGSISQFCKLLKQKAKHHRVSTGGPMCPRRMKRSCKGSLFSSTYDTRSCCRLVEIR